jgi:hypothetical protein
MFQLDWLDIDLIDWLLNQKIVHKVRSPIFTAQVLLNLYYQNPMEPKPPLPSVSDQARDSRRRKALRGVNVIYDNFVQLVMAHENCQRISPNIFQQKFHRKKTTVRESASNSDSGSSTSSSAKRSIESTEDLLKPQPKKTTIREPNNKLDDHIDSSNGTASAVTTQEELQSEENMNEQLTSEDLNIIEQPTEFYALHRLLGAKYMLMCFQNEELSQNNLPLLCVENITTEMVQDLYKNSFSFRKYIDIMKIRVKDMMEIEYMIKMTLQNKHNMLILKAILEERDSLKTHLLTEVSVQD